MRALQTFRRRPGSLLALGAALVASVPACACGFGLVFVPFVGDALLRVALEAAQEPHDAAPDRSRPASRSGAVGLWLALPVLAATASAGLCAALETALGRSLVTRAMSPLPAVAAVAALVVTAALSGPIALAACASAMRARAAISALDGVHARHGLRFSPGVTGACAALPLLLMAPWVALLDGGSWTITALLAALATFGAPFTVCALASIWTEAERATAPAHTPTDAGPAPSPSRPDRILVITLGVVVAAACALVLAASLTPARILRVNPGEASLDGPLRSFDDAFTLPGTTVRVSREDGAFGVSVADGGGAGSLPGAERARGFRIAPRPELCRSCVELELSGEHVTTRTLLDAAGVRHDDGPAARLASAGGLVGSLALLLAVLGTLTLAHRARRPAAASVAVAAAWGTAVLAFAQGVLH